MKKKTDIQLNDFSKTLNTLVDMYRENFDIVYNYFHSKFPNYVFYAFNTKSLQRAAIMVKKGQMATYFGTFSKEAKDIIYILQEKFESFIYDSNDKKVVDAYKNLQKIYKLPKKFSIGDKKSKSTIEFSPNYLSGKYKDATIYREKGSLAIKNIVQTNELEIKDSDFILTNLNNPTIKIKNYEDFEKIKNYVEYCDFQNREDLLFDKNGKLYENLKYIPLDDYDLKKVNWENKNIAGINITKNPEVNINFDKLVKDLTESDISGYDLKKYKLVGWNLTNANLRDTGAIIDLASCNITLEGKMNPGTEFDTDNTFTFGDRPLTLDEVESLGIKVYKKRGGMIEGTGC